MDSAALLDILGNENRRRILRLLSRKPCYVTEISEYLGVSPKAVIDHLRKLEEAGLVESRTDDQRRKYFHIARNLRLEVSVSPYEFGMKSAYPASANLDVNTCRYLTLDVQYTTGERDDGDGDSDDEARGPDDGERAGNSEGVGETAASQSDGGETGLDSDVDTDADGADERDADAAANGTEVVALASELNRLEDLQSELSLAQRWVHGRITDALDRLSDQLDADGESRLHAETLAAVAGGAETASEVGKAVDAPAPVVEDCLRQLAANGFVERDGDGDRWRLVG